MIEAVETIYQGAPDGFVGFDIVTTLFIWWRCKALVWLIMNNLTDHVCMLYVHYAKPFVFIILNSIYYINTADNLAVTSIILPN